MIMGIEHHLDDDCSIERLSQVANLSKYHFHRLFSLRFGMTIFSTISQLRTKRAVYELAFRSDIKIIDVALNAGYESPEAFSRAFKKKIGQSPRQFRQPPDWEIWYQKYQLMELLRSLIVHKPESIFDVKVINFEAVKVAVLEHRGAPQLLGNTIRQFIEWRKINKLPPKISRTFNLVYDDPRITADEDYRFDCCASVVSEIKSNELGLINKVIPKGRCAVIRHSGSDEFMASAIDYLYTDWLEKSAEELRDFPLFFERISFFPDVSQAEMVTDIFLPIK